jgi:flagellar motility protein MotE (MotC chaperone)
VTIGFPATRLLPATIGVLAGLLAVKSVTLVRGVAVPDATIVFSFPSTHARAAASAAPAAEAAKPSNTLAAADTADRKKADDKPREPPLTATERSLLLELRQRREELDARETVLAERESVLTAAQQKLSDRVAELVSLQQRLEALDADRKRQDDASWQGLVKLYETMKPRDAATIFNELSMSVLVQVMDRMKDAKAASILAAMNPEKARLVTQELARLRNRNDAIQRQNTSPTPPRPPAPSG